MVHKFLPLYTSILMLLSSFVWADSPGMARAEANKGKKEAAFHKAHETTSAYWGMGKIKKADGKLTSALVLGKRTYDISKSTVQDDQYYISQNRRQCDLFSLNPLAEFCW